MFKWVLDRTERHQEILHASANGVGHETSESLCLVSSLPVQGYCLVTQNFRNHFLPNKAIHCSKDEILDSSKAIFFYCKALLLLCFKISLEPKEAGTISDDIKQEL